MRPLDLSVPRGVGEVLDATFSLFGRHAALFLGVTVVVVAPVVVLVDGVWGGTLTDGSDAAIPPGALAVGGVLTVVVPALVTALYVGIVWALGSGGALTVREGLRAGVRRFPVALAAVVLYAALALAGVCLFLLPGVWVMVIGWFCAQTAVVERVGPIRAFERSVALVRGQWWWTFGALALSWIVFPLMGEAVRSLVAVVDAGVPYVALLALVNTAEFSLTALYGTLVFFALRARAAERAEPVAA